MMQAPLLPVKAELGSLGYAAPFSHTFFQVGTFFFFFFGLATF